MRSRFDSIPAASSGRQPSPKRSLIVQLPPPQPPQPPPPPQLPPLQEEATEPQPLPPQVVNDDRFFSSNTLMIGKLVCGRAVTPNTAINNAASPVAPPGRIMPARF